MLGGGGGLFGPPPPHLKILKNFRTDSSSWVSLPDFSSYKICFLKKGNVAKLYGGMLPYVEQHGCGFHKDWTDQVSLEQIFQCLKNEATFAHLLSWVGTWQSPLYSHLSCGGAQMVSHERPCWKMSFTTSCQTNPSRMTTSNDFLRVRRGAASASKNWLGHRVTSPRKMPCPKWGPCAPDVVSPLAGSTWLGCAQTVQSDRLLSKWFPLQMWTAYTLSQCSVISNLCECLQVKSHISLPAELLFGLTVNKAAWPVCCLNQGLCSWVQYNKFSC